MGHWVWTQVFFMAILSIVCYLLIGEHEAIY